MKMPLPPHKERTAYGTYLYFSNPGALETFIRDYRQILTAHFQKIRIEGTGEYWTCGQEHYPRNWGWKRPPSSAWNKQTIDNEVYETIKKIGRDLLPMQRIRIIESMWDSKTTEYNNEWVKITDVAESVNTPGTTAKRLLEDLMAVGVMNRKLGEPAEDGGRPPWLYQISTTTGTHIVGGDVFCR